MFLILILILIFIEKSSCNNVTIRRNLISVNCQGHDACKNKIWNGNYDIVCGGTNSERTCHGTTLNCGSGSCSLRTTGSGHDAYQNSVVYAKESSSFKLTCSATGQRDCRSITIWCPQSDGSSCECISCPSTVTLKCIQGLSCTSVSNANVDYVLPDKYQIPDSIWDKDTTHTGKRPDCLRIQIPGAVTNQNYKWGTLKNVKKPVLKNQQENAICYQDMEKLLNQQQKNGIVDFMLVLIPIILIG